MSAQAVTSSTGSVLCSLRAALNVSKPVIAGMRTSEIIMLIRSLRSVSSARSPEDTTVVSNPCPFRNESSRLRWPGSSSTIRIRGERECSAAAGKGSGAVCEFEMSDSESGAPRFVRQILNFPSVRQNNLLNDSKPEPGTLLVCRKVRSENLAAVFGRDPRPIIADLENCSAIAAIAFNANFPFGRDRLNRIDQQIEQRLPQ